jgi:hypothetical protein
VSDWKSLGIYASSGLFIGKTLEVLAKAVFLFMETGKVEWKVPMPELKNLESELDVHGCLTRHCHCGNGGFLLGETCRDITHV